MLADVADQRVDRIDRRGRPCGVPHSVNRGRAELGTGDHEGRPCDLEVQLASSPLLPGKSAPVQPLVDNATQR